MLAQLNSHVLEVASFVVAVNLGTTGILLKVFANYRRELAEHKKTVRYVDTCDTKHEGLDKLADERHKEVKKELKEIKDLIRNNGKPPLRVQT